MAGTSVCGRMQVDGSICTNQAGCRIPHPASAGSPAAESRASGSTDGGYSTPTLLDVLGWQGMRHLAAAYNEMHHTAEEQDRLIRRHGEFTEPARERAHNGMKRVLGEWRALSDTFDNADSAWDGFAACLDDHRFKLLPEEQVSEPTRTLIGDLAEERTSTLWRAFVNGSLWNSARHRNETARTAFDTSMVWFMCRGASARQALDGAREAQRQAIVAARVLDAMDDHLAVGEIQDEHIRDALRAGSATAGVGAE